MGTQLNLLDINKTKSSSGLEMEVAWMSCPKCLWIFLLFKLSSSQNYSAYVRYRYQRLSKDINILHLVEWVFLKEKQKKALLPFHFSSVDVVPRCLKQHLKITQLLHSLVFFCLFWIVSWRALIKRGAIHQSSLAFSSQSIIVVGFAM